MRDLIINLVILAIMAVFCAGAVQINIFDRWKSRMVSGLKRRDRAQFHKHVSA
jgi:hypothetical protein